MPASILAFEVVNKTHFAADTWRIDLEPWQQPEGFGLQFWADQVAPGAQAEIFAGFLDPVADVASPAADLTSLILGVVDDIEADPLRGRLSLSGRDLTAKLIDARTSNKWPQQTASQIVTNLAQQVGLTAQVTATTTPAGQYYRTNYAQIVRSVPMWDLIVFLAKHEGYDAYVTGMTLYFGPPQDDPHPLLLSVGRTVAGSIAANTTSLELRRSLTLAQDITVTVLSHQIATGAPIKVTASRAGIAVRHDRVGSHVPSGRAGKSTQNYVFSKPNLTTAQAQQFAQKMLEQLSQFERTLDAGLEADPSFSARRKVRLSGSGTSFDQDYYVYRLTRNFTFGEVFSMTLNAKNHPAPDITTG